MPEPRRLLGYLCTCSDRPALTLCGLAVTVGSRRLYTRWLPKPASWSSLPSPLPHPTLRRLLFCCCYKSHQSHCEHSTASSFVSEYLNALELDRPGRPASARQSTIDIDASGLPEQKPFLCASAIFTAPTHTSAHIPLTAVVLAQLHTTHNAVSASTLVLAGGLIESQQCHPD